MLPSYETFDNSLSVTYTDVEASAKCLASVVHRTPVLTSQTVNDRTGCQVFFKCENFQRTGSFKFRGAYNSLMNLSVEQRQQGIVTYSSGNCAQAIALAGSLLSTHVVAVMSDDTSSVKQAALQEYGAEVIFYNRQKTLLEELVKNIANDRNLTAVPPCNYSYAIAGYATAAKELIEEVGHLDILLVGCNSGGLLSGSAIAAKVLSPNCYVIGVESAQANTVNRSFRAKKWRGSSRFSNVVDEICLPLLGQIALPLVLHYVDEMVTVSDAAILRTMLFLWERLNIVVEPTGVLAATALLEKVVITPSSRVGVIISGGNADLELASKQFSYVSLLTWDFYRG